MASGGQRVGADQPGGAGVVAAALGEGQQANGADRVVVLHKGRLLADGSRAAFKPQQSNPQTVPRKEAAAYALSRLLGLNLVSPVVMRTLSRDEIFAKLDTGSRWAKKRIDRETRFDADGQTLGYWGMGTGPYLVLPILGPSTVRARRTGRACSAYL